MKPSKKHYLKVVASAHVVGCIIGLLVDGGSGGSGVTLLNLVFLLIAAPMVTFLSVGHKIGGTLAVYFLLAASLILIVSAFVAANTRYTRALLVGTFFSILLCSFLGSLVIARMMSV